MENFFVTKWKQINAASSRKYGHYNFSIIYEAAIAHQGSFWYSFECGNSKRFKRTKCTLSSNQTRPRESREGWPLLTVETEVNGESKSTNERGPSLVGLVVPMQEIWFSLGCSSRPSTKYIFPHHRTTSWAGSRAGSPLS